MNFFIGLVSESFMFYGFFKGVQTRTGTKIQKFGRKIREIVPLFQRTIPGKILMYVCM